MSETDHKPQGLQVENLSKRLISAADSGDNQGVEAALKEGRISDV